MKSINDIRESGILENYVLGLLDANGVKEVESYLVQYPELKKDYLEIQLAMQKFAKSNAIEARKGLSDDITSYINKNAKINTPPKSKTSDLFKIISTFLIVGLAGLAFVLYSQSKEFQNLNDQLSEDLAACDTLTNSQSAKVNQLEELISVSSNKINFTPTANYQNVELILHNNNVTKKNFLQIINLPDIGNDQAFQLWSLKDGINPIPMDVFTQDGEAIIPIQFEDDTKTYAITIEKAGGSTTPNLAQLIGTVNV